VLQSAKSCEGVYLSEADGTTEIPLFMKNATTKHLLRPLKSFTQITYLL